MIKRYQQFILEDNNTNSMDISEEIKNEVKKMIESTIDKSGGELSSFIDKFIESSEDVKIEGLINDSDIFDFYLKWRNDIDPILNKINFFDESPSKFGSLGLYEYVVSGTNRAIELIVSDIKGQ